MSQKIYKDFLLLFKRFPIDSTKKGRDLGEHLRQKFSAAFKQGELSDNIDVAYWTRTYKEVERLINDEFYDKYPRAKATGALNVGRVQCKIVVSNSAMDLLAQKKRFETEN